MKICAIICEYNPFHNGHLYQLREAKRLSGADAVLCLMSGNFVQRGEAAIVDKWTRAKHAILSGADIVVELPTVFATSNAELFAKGAISLLANSPNVTTLCFGAENADKQAFLSAAALLNNEPQEISLAIKEYTANGMSYAKARMRAWEHHISPEFLSSPNNILGLEYTRAILSAGANIDILPIQRVGGGYTDTALLEQYSSASAIRAAISSGKSYENNLPDYVAKDLPAKLEQVLDCLEKYAVLNKTEKEIACVCDCTEGLENAFKKAAEAPEVLAESLTSARYTASRIRRIALQNLLNIEESFIRACLYSPLYLRVLAAKKERTDVLSSLSNQDYPLLIRAHDSEVLTDTAKYCLEIDKFAEKVYTLLYPTIAKEKTIFIGLD